MENKATTFEFTSYDFDPQKKLAVFNYKTEFEGREPILWTETINLPNIPDLKNIPQNLLEKTLQGLHIILGISYYKFYCPPAVAFAKAKEGATDNYYCATILTKQEADFWNVVYKKGLGEFFYRNNINPNRSPKFLFDKNIKSHNFDLPKYNKLLIGVSGGKDSIVGAELLKETGEDLTAFYVETNKESELVNNVIASTGLKQLKIRRFLDPQVFQKHQYNGHIPISAIYAFLGIFASILYKYDSFIVSNEYSSNFGNINWKGQAINHQWSKTFEFEKIFSEYLKEYFSENLSYFSILRPFYEIRAVEMFCKYPKYFFSFSSCNNNFKIKKEKSDHLWCRKCAKCVFVFTLLSAFLKKSDLLKIFKENLYQDESLIFLFKDILGLGDLKPFDCVGTFEEAQTAFKMAHLRQGFGGQASKKLAKKCKIYPEVFKTQKENVVPEKFRFLGMKNALILGYGKEGIITKKFLNKFYPKLKIGIADEKFDGKNYLNKQKDFDIAIKTPGINKNLVTIPHTTATNIFFSKVLENNKIVGITGSKGKSTTSTLIYEILKAGGKNVEFLGNIGKPMLEYLLENKPKGNIFVLELSSYQLDDIKFSPNISVVTNLFPEHLNYHGDLKKYYKAKKNIIDFQTKNDYFVYNPNNKDVLKWLKSYTGKALPFSKSDLESCLLGEHNKSNIGAAVKVAEILGISSKVIAKTVKNFKGLAHRLEFVGEFKGIKFYDDAISTTPDSTIMAIKSLPKIGTIFLGGQDRGYKFTQLEKIIKKYKIKNIVLFPDSGRRILKNKKGLNILETKSMQEAVKFAYKNTEKGSICLLSCASPSYSLWKNFEEKGDLFKKFVKNFSK